MQQPPPLSLLPIVMSEKTDKSWKKTIGLLKSNDVSNICSGLVTSDYVKNTSIPHSDFVILGYGAGKETRSGNIPQLRGFLLSNELEYPNFLYIDVVCANVPGLGEKLIKIAEERANKRGLKGIILSSLPHVVGYYHRLGYKNRDTCIENIQIEQGFNTLAYPFIAKYKKDVSKYIDTDEGQNYRGYLHSLIKNKLAKNKNCKSVEECKVDGYLMTKCFQELPQQQPLTYTYPPQRNPQKTPQRRSQRQQPQPEKNKKRSRSNSNYSAESKGESSMKKQTGQRLALEQVGQGRKSKSKSRTLKSRTNRRRNSRRRNSRRRNSSRRTLKSNRKSRKSRRN
jgi:hypothetical protein